MKKEDFSNNDEIDILNYLKIIIKGKVTIIIVLIICLSFSIVVNLLLPKLYEVSMQVLPPTNEDGGYIYGVKFFNSKVHDFIFLSKLKKDLKLKKDDSLFIKFNSLDSNIIKVSMKSKESDVDVSKKILDKIFEQIVKDDDAGVTGKKQLLDQEIYINKLLLKENKVKLTIIDKEIAANLRKVNKNRTRIDNVKLNIRLFKNRIDLLSKKKKDDLEKIEDSIDGKKQDIEYSGVKSTMLYLELFKLLNRLDYDLLLLESEKDELNIEKERFILEKNKISEQEIKEIEFKLERFEKKRSVIQNIKQIHPPRQTKKPVKPKLKQNIAISVILGLLLGVLLTFIMDFYKKSIRKEAEEN
ncbi:MAG: hypothetical protein KAI43_03565 [Candidatus Aureabacteria bacterium]|nr:hypothetical protein [Candidatus Auribacterota bacterium]